MDTILAFINSLEYEKRYSKNTIISYQNDLNQFKSFCAGNETIPKDAAPMLIRAWVVSLFDTHTRRTILRKLSSLKSYYKFLLRQGVIQQNPLDKVLYPKTGKRIPEFVDQPAIDFLLDHPPLTDGFSGIRNQLIVKLLYFTGIRLNELINLKNRDINLPSATIKVLGKRNKERIIPVSPDFIRELEEFINLKALEFGAASQPWFFVTDKGNKLYPKLVYRVVNSYLNLVTTKTKKSPHVLRHTFATHLLNNGAELTAIKELLGHSNLSATQVYTHTTFKKLKSIYKQAHPRA
ncbi:MAG: tyrosine-type recombinase/integrase [Bacteroidota bacterium]